MLIHHAEKAACSSCNNFLNLRQVDQEGGECVGETFQHTANYITRQKQNIKNVTRYRDSGSAELKQGNSIQPHPTYL